MRSSWTLDASAARGPRLEGGKTAAEPATREPSYVAESHMADAPTVNADLFTYYVTYYLPNFLINHILKAHSIIRYLFYIFQHCLGGYIGLFVGYTVSQVPALLSNMKKLTKEISRRVINCLN